MLTGDTSRHPRAAPGFRFTLAPGGLTFEEFRSPSLVRQKTGGRTRDLLSRGSCRIEAATGRVLGVALTAGGADADFNASFDVRFAEEPALKLLVPAEMKEEQIRIPRSF